MWDPRWAMPRKSFENKPWTIREANGRAILGACLNGCLLCGFGGYAPIAYGIIQAELHREIGQMIFVDLLTARGAKGEVGLYQATWKWLKDAGETEIGDFFDIDLCLMDHVVEPEDPFDEDEEWWTPAFEDPIVQTVAFCAYMSRYAPKVAAELDGIGGQRMRTWMLAALHHQGPSPNMAENPMIRYLATYQDGIDEANRALDRIKAMECPSCPGWGQEGRR